MYVFLLLMTVVLSLLIKNKRKYVAFFGLMLLIVSCIRSECVGGDLTSYRMIFNSSKDYSFDIFFRIRYEPLFSLLYLCVHKVGGSFRLFMIICSVLSLIGPVFFTYKYSKQPWVSFFIYIAGTYYLSTLSMLRACISMSISMFAIDALMESKLKKSIIFFIISCLFHYSAIILGLLYFYEFIKNKKQKYIISTLMIFITVIGGSYIRQYISSIYSSAYSLELNAISGRGYFMLVLFVGIAILGLAFHPDHNEDSMIYKSFKSLMMCALLCQVMATYVSLFTREARFFIIPAVIMLPSVVLTFNEKNIITDSDEKQYGIPNSFYIQTTSNNIMITIIICVVFLVLFWNYIRGNDSSNVLPYVVMKWSEIY